MGRVCVCGYYSPICVCVCDVMWWTCVHCRENTQVDWVAGWVHVPHNLYPSLLSRRRWVADGGAFKTFAFTFCECVFVLCCIVVTQNLAARLQIHKKKNTTKEFLFECVEDEVNVVCDALYFNGPRFVSRWAVARQSPLLQHKRKPSQPCARMSQYSIVGAVV